MERRTFISTMSKTVGSAALLSVPVISEAASFDKEDTAAIMVGDIIDLFIKQIPDAPIKDTVDTLKSGSRDIVVTGIVTTMFATIDVIKKAIAVKANFIIAHEPTFYNHADDTSWLESDDVYQFKRDLLKWRRKRCTFKPCVTLAT